MFSWGVQKRVTDALEVKLVVALSHHDVDAGNPPCAICNRNVCFQKIASSIVLHCLPEKATVAQFLSIPLWVSACLSLCGFVSNLYTYLIRYPTVHHISTLGTAYYLGFGHCASWLPLFTSWSLSKMSTHEDKSHHSDGNCYMDITDILSHRR